MYVYISMRVYMPEKCIMSLINKCMYVSNGNYMYIYHAFMWGDMDLSQPFFGADSACVTWGQLSLEVSRLEPLSMWLVAVSYREWQGR